MFEIKVSQELKNACPFFAGAAVYAAVKNTAFCEGLWKEINAFTEDLTTTTQMEDIKRQPVIAATREAYKRCGNSFVSDRYLGRPYQSGFSSYRTFYWWFRCGQDTG